MKPFGHLAFNITAAGVSGIEAYKTSNDIWHAGMPQTWTGVFWTAASGLALMKTVRDLRGEGRAIVAAAVPSLRAALKIGSAVAQHAQHVGEFYVPPGIAARYMPQRTEEEKYARHLAMMPMRLRAFMA